MKKQNKQIVSASFKRRLKTSAKRRLNATQIILLGFILLILLGALLLTLPISSKNGGFTPISQALFTSVSATCVTGLSVVNTGAYWSTFGQIVIITLIQIGGLGFMTLAVMLSIFIKRQITPRERIVVAQSLGLNEVGGAVRLVKRILIGTFAIEGAGAVALMTQFIPKFGIAKGIYYGIFHSISAFCNAGFDLLNGLEGFTYNYTVGITLMLLIIIGGIGFIVWDDIVNLIKKHERLSIYSRLVLITSAVLIIACALLVGMFEWNNPDTLGNLSVGDKIYQSIFQSVTTRTAGFDLIGNTHMTDSSQLICLFFMLIGGASGSTAGGVKVGSLCVLIIAILGCACGRSEFVVYKRRIPGDAVIRAATMFVINLSCGVLGGILVAVFERIPLLTALYETISAISTVGLSLSLSPTLSLISMIIVMILMFFGRVGVLTITYSIMLRQSLSQSCIKYPELNLMIG
ncbi:MAG: Trk family potassium uptake protein [Clostridiales bacterium]|nr:Trk family potassium uptake protein [Clostridiales bacterium]